ncbi:MAG: endonuclease/exonuclease/phosphatase family protein [Clostridia bacterium]|nr:endonuclease/exonuclease/phosphatase family protein [Clostridia bacterium]
MKKRMLALLLAALMLLSLLAACKPNPSGGDVTTDPGTGTTASVIITTEEGEKPIDPPSYDIDPNASVYSGTPDTSWYTGDKTEYILTSADQLVGMNTLRTSSAGSITFEGVTIKLDCDVLINEGTADEIMARGYANKIWQVPSHSKYLFKGTLDGQGHTVSGVYIPMENSGISGMFGSLAGNAEIKNLNVVNSCLIAAPVADKQILGCLSGRILESDSDVKISNVLINFNFGEEGYAVNRVGGFFGDVCSGAKLTMENCEYYGNLNITGEYAGGLIGYVSNRNMNLSFINCKVGGNITANEYAGGFFGAYTANSLTLTDCSSNANVKATSHVGGIAGCCVTDTYSEKGLACTAKVEGKEFVGDIMGFSTVITDPTGGARPATTPEGTTQIRVMSFNLRLNLPETSGGIANVKAHRLAAAKAEIEYYDPDILGVQEDTYAWNTGLILNDYNIIMGSDYKNENTERTAIYYKKGLTLLEGGNVWLTASGKESGAALTVADLFEKGGKYEMSEELLAKLGITKDSPDSVLKDKHYTYVDKNGVTQTHEGGYVIMDTRNAVWGVFDINGQIVIHVNTHLQHRGQDSVYSNDALQEIRNLERVKEFSYIQELLQELKKKYPDAQIVMTGDWNDHPMSDIYNAVVGAGYICSNFTAETRVGPHCSWNQAFNGDKHGHNYPSQYEGTGTTYLDYIFVTDGISTLKFASGRGKATITDENGKDLTIYTSDHLPIIADICFKTEKTGSPIDPDYKEEEDDLSKPSYFTGRQDISWYTGDKTEYVLTTADQLAGLMALRINSKGTTTFEGVTIKLGRDMIFNEGDLSQGATHIWPTIHSSYLFKGTFDGQGHTVSGIYMPYEDSGVKGMFGGVGGNAVFKDLKLENFYYSAPPKDKGITGALIAKVSGGGNVTISNVTVDGYACENSNYSYYCVGGIVGWIESSSTLTMENCTFNGKINFPTQGTEIGGLVGTVKKGCTLNLKDCVNNGELIGKDYVGGLVGSVLSGGQLNVENSQNKGTITVTGTHQDDVVGKDQRS